MEKLKLASRESCFHRGTHSRALLWDTHLKLCDFLLLAQCLVFHCILKQQEVPSLDTVSYVKSGVLRTADTSYREKRTSESGYSFACVNIFKVITVVIFESISMYSYCLQWIQRSKCPSLFLIFWLSLKFHFNHLKDKKLYRVFMLASQNPLRSHLEESP